MRKSFAQCCFALLLAPVLVFMLIGTAALAADAGSGTGGGTGSSTPPATSAYPQLSVTIQYNGSSYGAGDTIPLTFAADKTLSVEVKRYTDATSSSIVTGARATWKSSDTTVATIDLTSGRLRAVGVGETEITATVTHQSMTGTATCKVKVSDLYQIIITEYNFNVTRLTAEVNETRQLRAVVTKNKDILTDPAPTVTWTSSDPSVATVGTDGLVTTLKVGETQITASYTDPNGGAHEHTVTCVVKASTNPPDGGDDPGTNPPGDQLPEGVTVKTVRITTPDKDITMDPGTQNVMAVVTFAKEGSSDQPKNVEWTRDGNCTVTYTDETDRKNYTIPVTWESGDRNVAYVSAGNSNGRITAQEPGEAEITASAGGMKSDPLKITVRGYKLLKDSITMIENESVDPVEAGIIQAYGDANTGLLSYWPKDSYIATYLNGMIVGSAPGTTTFTVSAGSGTFRGTFDVTVTSDPNATIEVGPIKNTDILRFSSLLSQFRRQAGGSLSHITGLNVDPKQGTLYYKYNSESVTGSGVGSGNYYHPDRNGGIPSGQRSLADITFVPKSDYPGGLVTISYTAVSEDGKNYSCKILVNVTSDSGSAAGITRSTDYNTPLKFNSDEFNRVCRERLGVNLSYVVFAQPPERQGMLYTNYSGTGNYGSVVDIRRQYALKELDDVWFVPAPGYSGSVTVYYTAYGVGANGGSYAGQVNITVNPESSVDIGGLAYDVFQGGVVRFDDEHFNNYCRDILYEENRYDRQTLSYIRFDSLPTESEGVLYYDYRSSTNTGSRAASGTSYYYGVRNPRIDRLAFVPAADFTGTLKLPFTGWTADGTRFTGSVEINVRSGSGSASGDIYYNCQPGRTVNFRSSDFTSLSQAQAGRTLDYIVFQSLPDAAEGSLYYGTSRITSTGSRYQNSNISRLSFRASNSFSGLVNIPFEGRAANGVTFHGVVTIGSDYSGSGSWSNIRYVADSKNPAVFARNDFDSYSQWETGRDISSVRFTIPSSGQGTLYRNYRSSSSQGTQITSSNTSISAGDLDRVAFVPAAGYTGTVYLDFTATASGSGGTFTGTVEVEVDLPPADVTARYSTRTEPVCLYSGDLARNNSTLRSVQFSALPAASEGYLYYQYSSPAHYGQMAGTGIAYQPSGSYLISDLAFVPRAGYTGTVTIPYTGTNTNGSTFTGEVLITVSPTYSSAYFSDMAGYSNAQRSAVDFLYDHNITRGITSTQYGPESSIRRGDFARMLYQAFELSPTGSSGAFRDVPNSAYYAEAVNTLYQRGIVSGIGNGLYAPNSTLTRQDAICMVQRAMRTMGWNASDGYSGTLSGYSDGGSVSGYAQGAMSFAVQRGYLPISGGRLNPTQALTRVDMAEIIHRVLTY